MMTTNRANSTWRWCCVAFGRALACALALTCAPARAHNCGPTFIGLKIGEGRLWRIFADLTEVETSYTIQVSPNPAVAEVIWDSPTLENPFLAHHGDFGIRGVGVGQTTLRVHWSYTPTGAQGVCEVLISVTPPFATGDSNLDGNVDGLDVQPFIEQYDEGNSLADLNEDSFYTTEDLTMMGKILLTRPADGVCDIASFDAPFELTDCTTVPPFGVIFAMVAVFNDACSCCEYRQYVRGEFRVNGRILNKALTSGDRLEKLVYHEDGLVDPPAGANRYYGHRVEPFNNPGNEYLNPNERLKGCSFVGLDAPKIGPAPASPPNATYSMDVYFIGEIVDVCNDFTVKDRRDWPVKCSGSASRGTEPDPLIERFFNLTLDDTPVLLSVIRYDDDVLVVGVNVEKLGDSAPVDESAVTVTVAGFTPQTVPASGALPETSLRGDTAHALYAYAYPPGSAVVLNVDVSLNGDGQSLVVIMVE